MKTTIIALTIIFFSHGTVFGAEDSGRIFLQSDGTHCKGSELTFKMVDGIYWGLCPDEKLIFISEENYYMRVREYPALERTMNKIEDLLIVWKAAARAAEKTGHPKLYSSLEGRISEARAALKRIKEPSPIQMQIDTKPECNKCGHWYFLKIGDYCPSCGRALSQ